MCQDFIVLKMKNWQKNGLFVLLQNHKFRLSSDIAKQANAMVLGKLGEQVVLMSEKALLMKKYILDMMKEGWKNDDDRLQ